MTHRPSYERHELIVHEASGAAVRIALIAMRLELSSISPAEWDARRLKQALRNVAGQEGVPERVLKHPLRVAFGLSAGLDLYGSMEEMGIEECLARIDAAIQVLSVVANAQ